MYELFKLLVRVRLGKLIYKSIEFKEGFDFCLELYKHHAFESGYANELRDVKKQLENLKIETDARKRFLVEENELLKKRIKKYEHKSSDVQQLKESNKAATYRNRAAAHRKKIKDLLNTPNFTSEEKVEGVLMYLKSFSDSNTSEEVQESKAYCL